MWRRADPSVRRSGAMKRNMVLTLCAVTVAMAALATVAVAAEQAIVVNFSSARPDGLPDGLVSELTGKGKPGQWSVSQDASAPSGRVLAQTSTDTTDYRFPLAVYQ